MHLSLQIWKLLRPEAKPFSRPHAHNSISISISNSNSMNSITKRFVDSQETLRKVPWAKGRQNEALKTSNLNLIHINNSTLILTSKVMAVLHPMDLMSIRRAMDKLNLTSYKI